MTATPPPDAFAARFALRAPEPLAAFNAAGVLAAADVHVGRRLAELAGEGDPAVALAAAFAVRAPRLGHVFTDLGTVRETATSELEEPVDLAALPWPEPRAWREAVAASSLTAVGESESEGGGERPLRLVGARLYLDRYWGEEVGVAGDLRALMEAPSPPLAPEALEAGVARLFGEDPAGAQARAARAGVERRFAVVAGGPGTGKTTTVARLLALVLEQGGDPPPLVALAAPTGKAAARLEEAVHEEAQRIEVAPAVRDALLGLEASTLHRLLGRRPGSASRFAHHRHNRLPHDVVVVDETSMVSLSMMARLVEAVREDARLVLVGDPGQLTSIEAGAVLGDIVGPATAPGIVVLDRGYRFGGAIAGLAAAVRAGDADAVVAGLAGGGDEIVWIDADPAETPDLPALRDPAIAAATEVVAAAREGRAADALDALGGFRLLCAHRRGPHGAGPWMRRIEAWLGETVDGLVSDGGWYAGRPILVTENDYGLGLYNGDTGVAINGPDGRLSAAFRRRGELVWHRPTRLASVDTVYAMTIHKAQGSQFATAAVVLPPPESRILTRELLYTAVTRARTRLVIAGSEAAVRAAVGRPVARASGLRERLWAEP